MPEANRLLRTARSPRDPCVGAVMSRAVLGVADDACVFHIT